MTTYARIQSGLVAELFTTTGDITTMFNPALVWVPIGTSGAQVGWTYNGTTFTAPAPLPAPTKAQLQAAAWAQSQALLMTSRLYAVAGVTGSISCDALSSSANLQGINIWGMSAPTATQAWTDNAYNVFTLTGAEAVAFADAVLAYGQSVYATLAAVVTSINSGSTTTLAQISSAAWPT